VSIRAYEWAYEFIFAASPLQIRVDDLLNWFIRFLQKRFYIKIS